MEHTDNNRNVLNETIRLDVAVEEALSIENAIDFLLSHCMEDIVTEEHTKELGNDLFVLSAFMTDIKQQVKEKLIGQ